MRPDDNAVLVLGGGLAGSAAAITASRLGAAVTLVEKSAFPRHKVCGEFLSPAARPLLEKLGVAMDQAAPIRRTVLNFSGREKRFNLPETAWGWSRYQLDDALFQAAQSAGATTVKEMPDPAPRRRVIATGRQRSAPKGKRQFGFKAHFTGPSNDAVELYFFPGGYVGVNPVEGGRTNVCGLAREDVLTRHSFAIDELIASLPSLRERLTGLNREFDWLHVGPLVYANRFADPVIEGEYPAGDALSFVDPFTGSGMLSALKVGVLAGTSAATQRSSAAYQQLAATLLAQPFRVSTRLRSWAEADWVRLVIPLVPGRLLFQLTRPV